MILKTIDNNKLFFYKYFFFAVDVGLLSWKPAPEQFE